MVPCQSVRCLLHLAASLVVALTACTAADESRDARRYASTFEAVEVDPQASGPLRLAVQACAGLKNRSLGGSVYVLEETNDAEWLAELGLAPRVTVGADAFVASCKAEIPACVRYSYNDQQTLLPNILTVASALEALPVDAGLVAGCQDVVFDASSEFADKKTPYLATKYVFENFLSKTTGLAMLNPGYNHDATDLAHPELIRDMPTALVDFVFSERLFAVFLVNGCVDGNPEKALLSDIVNSGQWPTPLGVYGYNNSWLMGGYLYEAQTRCLDSRNMGAIPTETGNLSFFSTRRAPIVTPRDLARNEPDTTEYDPTQTYVAFVMGDGDNVRFIMTSRKDWLQERLAECGDVSDACPPLTWSISPHLAHLAPDVLQWYYRSSHETGKDYFILPPSGHFYAYPSSLRAEDQDRFAEETERDARILGVQSTVHWDFFDTWRQAEDDFLPKYARAGGAIRGIFAVNVPYSFPTFTWWPDGQFFKVLTGEDGGEAVVFKPREWRGVDDRDDEFFLSPKRMAAELAGYPKGTVTWVYMTSDGGLSLSNSYVELLKYLPSHVRLVSADAAARLALSAGRN